MTPGYNQEIAELRSRLNSLERLVVIKQWIPDVSTIYQRAASATGGYNAALLIGGPIPAGVFGVNYIPGSVISDGSISEAKLSFQLNSPYAPQVPATVSLPLADTAGVNTFTNLINVTEAGVLLALGVYVTIAVENLGNTGTITLDLGITVDGGTERFIPVYLTANPLTTIAFETSFVSLSTNNFGNGNQVDQFASHYLGVVYSTSLLVRARLNRNGTTNSPIFTVLLSAQRGVKL